MPVIETPSGHKVTLKDPKAITHGDRKALLAVSDDLSDSLTGYAIMDNLLAIAITEWEFDLLIPSVRRESLDKLSPTDYDAIVEATRPLMDAISPKTAETDEAKADPKAPTDS